MYTKRKIYQILENHTQANLVGRVVDFFLVVLVLVNVTAVVLETVESYHKEYDKIFRIIEFISVVVFTIEYILRLWVSDLKRKYHGGWRGRLKYFLSPMAIIDLLSILPFFIIIFFQVDLRYASMIRFMRMMRLVKLRRYSFAVKTLWNVLLDKKEELIITFVTIIVLLVVASSLMYVLERDAQPYTFSSIPATLWWGVCTLTTVGYGDMYPVTPMGKMLAAVIAMLGIAMFALPAALLSSGFSEQIQLQRKRKKHPLCPHCGKEIDLDEHTAH
jgi:voltage-gated potassium channel